METNYDECPENLRMHCGTGRNQRWVRRDMGTTFDHKRELTLVTETLAKKPLDVPN